MMYPYLKLNDDTEIAYSEMKSDGSVVVSVEKPDEECGLKTMIVLLPGYEVREVHEFSPLEVDKNLQLLRKTAHIIMQLAREGV